MPSICRGPKGCFLSMTEQVSKDGGHEIILIVMCYTEEYLFFYFAELFIHRSAAINL